MILRYGHVNSAIAVLTRHTCLFTAIDLGLGILTFWDIMIVDQAVRFHQSAWECNKSHEPVCFYWDYIPLHHLWSDLVCCALDVQDQLSDIILTKVSYDLHFSLWVLEKKSTAFGQQSMLGSWFKSSVFNSLSRRPTRKTI